jgi:3-phenylpropionate/trans-cinnamate dioxygenase ferredoxin reductase subunit
VNGRLLVVGAGQAGVQTASNVRTLGWKGPITLVGAEPHPPYNRPPLSKAFLRGTASAASLALREAKFYSEHAIDLFLDEHIENLDLTGGGAGKATSASGRTFAFDRLVLATGAAPRRLPIPGSDLKSIVTLRNIHDADVLAGRLAAVDDLVVIGGGLIGLEVAATAVAAGVRTTVVETAPWLMNRVVSKATSAYIEAAHRAGGLNILISTRPLRFMGDTRGSVTAVELEDGTRLAAGLVLMAVGARPRDELARAAGLACENGIVVDSCAVASDGRTIAVGDCTWLPDPSPAADGHTRLRLESVDNAVEQASVAAHALLDDPRPYRSVPWFWSDQGDLKLQIAGLARAEDEVIVRPGKKHGQQVVLRYRDGKLMAGECINSPADFLTLRKALAAGTSLSPEAAGDIGTPLKQHFAAAAAKCPAG